LSGRTTKKNSPIETKNTALQQKIEEARPQGGKVKTNRTGGGKTVDRCQKEGKKGLQGGSYGIAHNKRGGEAIVVQKRDKPRTGPKTVVRSGGVSLRALNLAGKKGGEDNLRRSRTPTQSKKKRQGK